MLDYTKEDLLELGAEITTREIYQQPDVWKEAFESYQARRDEIAAFLQGIADKHDYIKVAPTRNLLLHLRVSRYSRANPYQERLVVPQILVTSD